MGRMWNTLLLYKWKPIFAWLPIETLIRERRDAYYAALGQADISADATPFVEFLLSVIYGCRGTAADKRASAGKIALQRRAQPNGNRSIDQGVGSFTPTRKELKVLRHLLRGLSYTRVAAEMGCEMSTVKFHVANMLQKTGLENKLQLALAVSDVKLVADLAEE